MYENFILAYDNNLPVNFCKLVIEKFEENKDSHHIGLTRLGIDPTIKKTMDLFVSNKQCWQKEDKFLHRALHEALNKYYRDIPQEYNFQKMFCTNIQDRGYQIQRYTKDEGFYIWHNDMSIDDDGSFRILTFIWYLNDVEEGGETEFICGTKVKPKAGKIVIFPATWGAVHRGNVPVSNDKYIVTGWIYTKLPPKVTSTPDAKSNQFNQRIKLHKKNKKRKLE